MNIKWIVFLTVLFGLGVLFKLNNVDDVGRRAGLLEHVRIVKSAINVDRITSLKANESDLSNPDYIRLKEQLTDIADSMDGARYVYLMSRVNNQTVILVDTQPTKMGTDCLAIPGEVYKEADDQLNSLLFNNKVK